MNKKELEQFVAEHDAQICINILFDGTMLKRPALLDMLERRGFIQFKANGMAMVCLGAVSVPLDTVRFGSEQCRLTLILDVPLEPPELDALGRMVEHATFFARRLGGMLVDSEDKPLTEEALTDITYQVAEFYSSMEAAGIPAGSPEALRLFCETRGIKEIAIPSRYRYSLWNVVFGCFVGWNLVLAIIFLVQDKPLSGLVLLGMVALCSWGAFWPDKQAKDGSVSR